MEKIYVEENQKKKTNNKLSVSVGLSFAVAFMAIVSILFISMSGVTYSLDNVDTLPAKITTENPGMQLIPDETSFGDGNNYDGSSFIVHTYSAQINGSSKPVYCVESAIRYATKELNRGKKIEDEGFIYLLTKLDALEIDASKLTITERPAGSGNLPTATALEYTKYWLTQTAIWMYLGINGDNEPNSITLPDDDTPVYTAAHKNDLYSIKTLRVGELTTLGTITANSNSLFKDFGVNTILDTALRYYGRTDVLNIGLSKASDKFTLVNNDEYLKSDVVTVNFNTEGITAKTADTYKLTLAGAPEGTKVYGINNAQGDPNNGNEELITNLNAVNYKKYQQLYIYVPANKVTGKVEFSLAIDGEYEVVTGYYYEPSQANSAQRVTYIGKYYHTEQAGTDFSVSKAPDTGTDASSILYIIGMIVLLSGLGILYVNIKNQKQYQ